MSGKENQNKADAKTEGSKNNQFGGDDFATNVQDKE
jgi:hypothetical protein